MSHPIEYQMVDDVAVIGMDDGKVNALGSTTLPALMDALSRAEDEARALVEARQAAEAGRFSAGFNLKELTASVDSAKALLGAGGDFFLKLFTLRLPTVVACTGHALAGGAIVLMCADRRIGVAGDFKIGLNEVALGMPVPSLATELVRERLVASAWIEATAHARIYSPIEAEQVGYLDEVVAPDALMDRALEAASALARLNPAAYAATKRNLHRGVVERIKASVHDLIALSAVAAKA